MKQASIITVLTLVSLFAQPARSSTTAQSPATPQSNTQPAPCPPPPAIVASFLNFSPAQTEQFEILLTQFQTDLNALQQQIVPRQQQLDALLSQPNPNPAQIGALVVQVHALQQQQGQVLQGYQTAFAGLLTQSQQQQAQLITAASQVQPAVGAFVALQLVPPPPQLPCQKP